VPQPITISDFLAYCQLTGVDAQPERDLLYRIVSRMDAVFLEHQVARLKTK
jgi:hypothetical protein